MRMKKLLLLLLGAMMLNSTLWAVAPNSFVKFKVNGDKTPAPTFNKFSEAAPVPYNLGAVYRCPDLDKPNIGVAGYQLVILTEREGYENEYSHRMQAIIGVYEDNSNCGAAYYDWKEKKMYIHPTNSNTPIAFGQQFWGGNGTSEPMSEVMSADQFVNGAGEVNNCVLPNPLVYDAQDNTYKEGKYQKGHSYVIAIHFTEVADWQDDETSGVSYWNYPENSLNEYTSFNWQADHSKECLLASFTYACDEASTAASVFMTVNGEIKRYNLLGENQDPIDLGTIFSKEVTLKNTQEKSILPDLGFYGFIFESVVPVTYSAAVNTYGGSMTFTTLKKSVADKYIDEGFEVDYRDYKTANFGRINSDVVPAILCASPEGLVPLSENWAYDYQPLDVWVNSTLSGTYPVNVGWAGDIEDGETYTVAFYFSEHGGVGPAYIHRNGGKYYKFNFTYSKNGNPDAIESVSTVASDSAPWYSINGVELTAKPTAPGIYIHNGKKFVVY